MPLTADQVTTALQPYLVWIKVIVLLILCSLLFFAGWKVSDWRWEGKRNRELEAMQDKIAETQRLWEADRMKWELAAEVTAANLNALESQKDALVATLSGLKLTRTIKVEPNVQGECESAVLDDSFRLRWNTVVETAAASIAADRSN